MEPPSLPFFIPNVYEGLAKANGVARLTRMGLALEFELKDGLFGMLRSGVREVEIPMDDLAGLELRTGWFRTRLLIRTHRIVTVHKVPGHRGAAIELGVARHDRTIAQALVSVLRLQLSERELEKLGRSPVTG